MPMTGIENYKKVFLCRIIEIYVLMWKCANMLIAN